VASTPTSTTLPTVPLRVLEFSRIAVLFILEHSGDVQIAVGAHDSIQSFFEDPTGKASGTRYKPMGIKSSAQNYTMDFIKFTIRLGNGTIVGGDDGD